MMAQYRRIKGELPKDALLMFRLGDFYEMFFEDAVISSQLLQLTLTQRNGIPMCGLPYHAANNYIGRLLKAGRKVAICDQTEEAKPGKLVQREVTSILSPGTHFDDRLLRAERNNFLASIAFHGDTYGLACVDLTTGDFRLTELSDSKPLLAELERLRPAELIWSIPAFTSRRMKSPAAGRPARPARSGCSCVSPCTDCYSFAAAAAMPEWGLNVLLTGQIPQEKIAKFCL
jgi:DNA mismatch repair protein MutS